MSHPIGPTAPIVGRIVYIAVDNAGAGITIMPAIVTYVEPNNPQQRIFATAFPWNGSPHQVVANHAAIPDPPVGTWHWPPVQ